MGEGRQVIYTCAIPRKRTRRSAFLSERLVHRRGILPNSLLTRQSGKRVGKLLLIKLHQRFRMTRVETTQRVLFTRGDLNWHCRGRLMTVAGWQHSGYCGIDVVQPFRRSGMLASDSSLKSLLYSTGDRPHLSTTDNPKIDLSQGDAFRRSATHEHFIGNV